MESRYDSLKQLRRVCVVVDFFVPRAPKPGVDKDSTPTSFLTLVTIIGIRAALFLWAAEGNAVYKLYLSRRITSPKFRAAVMLPTSPELLQSFLTALIGDLVAGSYGLICVSPFWRPGEMVKKVQLHENVTEMR